MLNGTCFAKVDEDDANYMKFSNISSKIDWWYWAYSELIDLTYNFDEDFSTKATFCSTNSLIIGMPRIRLYAVDQTECIASNEKINGNDTITSVLNIPYCYPDYVDKVKHPRDFQANDDKKYEWDAHYLAIQHGLSSAYSYTKHEYYLPAKPFGAFVYLLMLNTANWLTSGISTRAIITEFTLYDPPTQLFSTVNFIAEFPASSGTHTSISIQSTHIQRYRNGWSYCAMFAELLMLPVAMYFIVKSILYIYKCRFRLWQSIWGFLEVILAGLLWAYVLCLMLRVQITEDLLWQLRVSYFQKYVNLKGAMTWDDVLDALLGFMIVVHLFRCLEILNFFKRFRIHGLVVAHAFNDVFHITLLLLVTIVVFVFLGFQWLHPLCYDFHTFYRSFISLISMASASSKSKQPIYDLPAMSRIFAGIYYFLTFFVFVLLFRGLYFAAFVHAKKTFVYHDRTVEITICDVFTECVNNVKSMLTKFTTRKMAHNIHGNKMIPSNAVPSTLFVAEIESQINSMMKKLDRISCKFGEECNLYDDQISPSSSRRSSFSNSSFRRRRQSDLNSLMHSMRSTSSKRTRFSSFDNTNYVEHADGFTEVSSCSTEVEKGRRLVKGIKVIPASMSLSSADYNPQQKVYDKNGPHMTKFLNDLPAISDENVDGSHFSKYGKRVLKMKPTVAFNCSKESMSTESKTEDAKRVVSKYSSSNATSLIDENLRKTKTMGHNKNSDDFWELNYLAVPKELQKK